MSDQVMKPVWRMNTGRGVPSDFGGFVMYENDGEAVKKQHLSTPSKTDHFSILRDGRDITHYQTNRTKAAMYERKDCLVCDGKGWFKSYATDYKRGTCHCCNGKGWRLEAIK